MAATLATACGDDNNDDNSVPVESITLNHETLTLKSGATETLVPTIVPDRVTAESVVWSSDKTSVATVSKDGLVTAVAEGTATITATAREKSATCLVTVSNKTLVTTAAELKTAIETADGTADAPTQIILGGYIRVAADAEHFIFSIDGKHVAIDGGNSPIGGNYNISRTASDKSLFELTNGASLKLTNLYISGNADTYSTNIACIFVRASCKLTLGNGFELYSGNGNDNDQLIGISVGDAEDIADVVSRWTGIPVSKMLQSEKDKLLHLEEELHQRVIGQDEAIEAVADAVRRSRAGLQDPKRPIGSFIFLGTTGVGKTELAKALAEFLFDDETMMTRIDMSEYQEKHSVSRLVGAPPGYVGYDEGGQLTEAIRRKPYSVVLFDEIEKAHPDVFNILLQVLDDGRLTDNKGRVVNFKNTIIIMTSNMGSSYIQSQMEKLHGSNKEEVIEETKKEVMNMLKKTIRPEFLNRIDETIMFLPLNEKEIKQIVLLQIKGVQKMLAENGVELQLTEGALNFLSQVGYDPEFGARPVKRAIQRYLLNDLSKKLLSQEVDRSKAIIVDADGDGLVFRN